MTKLLKSIWNGFVNMVDDNSYHKVAKLMRHEYPHMTESQIAWMLKQKRKNG